MLGYMLRKMAKLINIAKILNIIAFVISFFILAGVAVVYDWSRMPYSQTSTITVGNTLGSIGLFGFITFTLAFSFYVLRRSPKE